MEYDKYSSRKYRSAWGLTWLTTTLLVASWLIPSFIPITTPFIPAEWITIIMFVWGSYFAANVASKGVTAWQDVSNNKNSTPYPPIEPPDETQDKQ
jgi:hypothetical protein